MHRYTINKAIKLVKCGSVKLCEDSKPPNFLHFKVTRNKYDIYRTVIKDQIAWSCNAQRKDWGCMLNIKQDRSKPFCSHTLAAELYIKHIWREEYTLSGGNDGGD